MFRHDWTLAEVRAIHDLPLLDLVHCAQTVHREHFGDNRVQLCSLLSVKTGGCPEDCAYCPQAARYHTDVRAEPLMEVDDVLAAARKAREAGATRFCMGAAWREVKDGPQFDRVLEMVRGGKRIRSRCRSTCWSRSRGRRWPPDLRSGRWRWSAPSPPRASSCLAPWCGSPPGASR